MWLRKINRTKREKRAGNSHQMGQAVDRQGLGLCNKRVCDVYMSVCADVCD